MPSQFYRKVLSLSKTPAEIKKPQLVESSPPPTVVACPSTTVVDDLTTTVVGYLWKAEANGALFPRSRVRPIVLAQDALNHVEESVYDVLWGPKNQVKESHRTTQIGYGQIAKTARITKRNAALIVERLVEKGFIVVEQASNTATKTPCRYRVAGYRAVLDDFERKGRKWFVRSGNGILFVHPLVLTDLATTVVAGYPTTVVADEPTTVAATTTMVAGQSTTVVAATTPFRHKKQGQEVTSSSSSLVVRAAADLDITDDDVVRRICEGCREERPDATYEEIAGFIAKDGPRLRNNPAILNFPGAMIKQIRNNFRGEPFELFRAQKAAEALALVEANRRAVEDYERQSREEADRQESDQAYGQLRAAERADRECHSLAEAKKAYPRAPLDEQNRIAKERAMRAFHEERMTEGKSQP